ncbi:N-acetyl-gamma-glutamyl-phosphate reductase [Methanohalophilus sp.]
MKDKVNAGIIGATGYTGGELMRLLLNHPHVNLEMATSRKLAGKKVSKKHGHLAGMTDLEFEELDSVAVRQRCDVVFLAVPHGSAMDIVPQLIDSDLRIVDLSADYRLGVDEFEKVYNLEHRDPRKAAFGLVELHPEVKGETFVANPGCYPTGATLAAAPVVKAGLANIAVFDSKSGITGAGVNPSHVSHYPNMAENIQPYKLTTHRHRAEIWQELNALGGLDNVNFTPHIIPAIRGILTTAHLFLNEECSKEDIRQLYDSFYSDCPFVRLVEDIPGLDNVRGSNFCDIGFEIDANSNRLVVVSAIDNLVKGASGQAIQNMNLMCGFKETDGLWNAGLAP